MTSKILYCDRNGHIIRHFSHSKSVLQYQLFLEKVALGIDRSDDNRHTTNYLQIWKSLVHYCGQIISGMTNIVTAVDCIFDLSFFPKIVDIGVIA